MATEKDGWAAFPSEDRDPEFAGMSLRDYFAAQALPAVSTLPAGHLRDADLTRLFGKGRSNITGAEVAAALAYEIADAMLARRNQQ